MNEDFRRFARHYTASLKQYLADEQEAGLEQAYELGRRAMADKWGILEVARAHMEARETLLPPVVAARMGGRELKSAGIFFLQALSPFEATHRGFGETNLKLQQRNRELEAEIRERRRVEAALRQSEKHYHRLFTEAQLMQEDLRSLSNRILRTQEEERKRISRELHDEVGQSLTAINVTLATVRNNLGQNAPAGAKLAEAAGLLQETLETVHRFARDLRPAMLDELGLLPALRSYLKGFASRTGLRVHLRANPIAEKLTDEQKTVVFRITQESLTNVSKHAQASQVKVFISKLKEGIHMEITDDGRSFNGELAASGRSNGRLGLLGMKERVRLVNGRFAVKPQPGKGTTVRVVLPFIHPDAVRKFNHQPTEVHHGKNKSSSR